MLKTTIKDFIDLEDLNDFVNVASIEKEIATETGKPVYKPANPFLVTPLGIALNCKA